MATSDSYAPARRYRIAVLGNLASVDLGLAQALRELGIRADVLREGTLAPARDFDSRVFTDLPAEAVIHTRDSVDLIRRLRSYDYVFSHSAQIGFWIGRFLPLYPLLQRLGWPPYANFGTGADIMERSLEDSLPGEIQRRTMRHAAVNVIPAYPGAVRATAQNRLTNVAFLPFIYRPTPAIAYRMRAEHKPPPPGGPLRILHATNLDWGAADGGKARESTKGGDRFIRALARFRAETDRELSVTMLDRGPDRAAAREMVEELGLGDVVTWHEELPHHDLYAAMVDADLIVDQFDIGALGGIAWEAMTLGRPVLTYVAPSTGALIYDEPPPVLNARTEDQILVRLREATEPRRLQEVAEATERWIEPRTGGVQLARYLVYPALAAGHGLDLLEQINPER
jgi:glycosyltransferase involved in cell wall biosynthesis